MSCGISRGVQYVKAFFRVAAVVVGCPVDGSLGRTWRVKVGNRNGANVSYKKFSFIALPSRTHAITHLVTVWQTSKINSYYAL